MSVQTVPVLADLIPGERVKDAALVLGGTAFLAVASQIVVPLWFTPVPLSLATFAVLLMGATYGPVKAGLSTVIFMLLGVLGLPVFAGFGSGWMSATFGYVLGYIAAAVVVGFFAQRQAGSRFLRTLFVTLAGSATIYAIGVPWLMFSLRVSVGEAWRSEPCLSSSATRLRSLPSVRCCLGFGRSLNGSNASSGSLYA